MAQGSPGGRQGRDERFRHLFDRHGQEIFRFFVRRGLTFEDARELTQETFLRVYQGMKGFRGDATARTWVFSIAHNVFRNALRHDSASKRRGDEVPLEEPGAAHDPDRRRASLSDPAAADPFDTTLAHERSAILRRAIEELPDRMRHCVLLWLDQDLKYREIATTLRVSIDTVKSQLHQAKERLREAVGDELPGRDAPGGPS